MCISVSEDAAKDKIDSPIRNIQKFFFVDTLDSSSSTGYISIGTTITKSATAKLAEMKHTVLLKLLKKVEPLESKELKKDSV